MNGLLSKDFLTGLLFSLVGGMFAYASRVYEMGDATQMGPGYFPRLIAWMTIAVGVVLMLRVTLLQKHHEGGEGLGPWVIRPLVLIISGNVAFGVMVAGLPSLGFPPMGLVAGVYVLTVLASLADSGCRFVETIVLATVLAALSSGVSLLLSLTVPIWPEFF